MRLLWGPVLLACAVGAYAQTPPTPGAVRESFANRAPSLPPTPAQVLLPEQVDAPMHDRNGKRFQVHSFRFVGASVFPAGRLKRVVERFLDMELNLYDLNVAADAVTEFYHDRGYTLARAIVPAQRIEDGVVTIAVVEGRVGGVLFSGNKNYDAEFLTGRVSALQAGSLLETRHLERSLLLLNDLPGLKARATLAPGAAFGSSDVLIKVEESRLAGTLAVDNAGRKETGRWKLDVGGELNNPLGIGDQLKLRSSSTDHKLSTSGSLGYSLPVGNDGWRLAFNYSDIQYDLGGEFSALGIQGSARTSDIALSWPLTRSRGHNETLTLTARKTRLIQTTNGIQTSNVTVPLINLSYQADWIDPDASVTNLLAQVTSNLRHNTNGKEADAVRLKLEVDGNYLLPLDRYWDLYLRGAAAYSPERLPDSEKYSLGGVGSVRGYRTSELRGDTGYLTTLELRRSLRVGSYVSTLSFFGDMGKVTYKAPGFADSHDGLSAYGVGLSVYPLPQTTLKVEWAQGARSYQASDGEHTRLWVSLSTAF